jgi:hypothetical protein
MAMVADIAIAVGSSFYSWFVYDASQRGLEASRSFSFAGISLTISLMILLPTLFTYDRNNPKSTDLSENNSLMGRTSNTNTHRNTNAYASIQVDGDEDDSGAWEGDGMNEIGDGMEGDGTDNNMRYSIGSFDSVIGEESEYDDDDDEHDGELFSAQDQHTMKQTEMEEL